MSGATPAKPPVPDGFVAPIAENETRVRLPAVARWETYFLHNITPTESQFPNECSFRRSLYSKRLCLSPHRRDNPEPSAYLNRVEPKQNRFPHSAGTT